MHVYVHFTKLVLIVSYGLRLATSNISYNGGKKDIVSYISETDYIKVHIELIKNFKLFN